MRIAECKNHNIIDNINEVISLPNFLQYLICLVHISKSLKENQMKLDTLKDGRQR